MAGELRANHENRWKESRQEIIQTQNELFRISQTQQAQVKAFIDESNQKQKELAEELRSNHENRWNGSRQEMVQFQNDLSRVSKANQGQITDSLIELIQKREEVENFLKNNHANRWSQAEDQLSKLTQVNQSLQQQATEMSDAHTKLYSLWQTSEQKNRRRIRMLTFLTWISCLLAFALLAVILYPYYQNYFIFLLDWQGIRH